MTADTTADAGQGGFDLDTLAVRAGTRRSQFGEHSEAMFLTSSFVFENAAQAAARFSGSEEGVVYSRFTNPTVTMFEERLAALEGAEACMATASGMSAVLVCCMTLLRAGDHVVASNALFGSTIQLFSNQLSRFGIETSFVGASDTEAWARAVRPRTRMFFLETPSNPLTELADIVALAELADAHDIRLVVDNCFCTPVLQRPIALGAHLVIHSATKYLDGQGRVLGGAVLGPKKYIAEQVLPFMRNAGPSLSPFNAWVLLKGLETLPIRMRAQSEHALALARWLQEHPAVERVYHPGLPSHPQHALAARQQQMGGPVVSFEVHGADESERRARAWRVIDGCRVLSITGNLGDTRSTITHPASTTHGRITPEARRAAGIGEGLIRVAVGLESLEDLQRDLARGLEQSGHG